MVAALPLPSPSRALITGARGTVGRALTRYLHGEGLEVIAWDRSRVPIDDYHAMERFVRESRADVVIHLATASSPTGRDDEGWWVDYHWSSELAWICRQRRLGFIFTSTALVFSNHAHGPFTLDSIPDAEEGYGRNKREAEHRVLDQYPDAWVIRLGWQIDHDAEGNNMVHQLNQRMQQDGCIRAGRRWIPACSFLQDTAAALYRCMSEPWPSGIAMLDSNAEDALSFDVIVRALDQQRGGGWRIETTEDFVYDQRMIDPRCDMPSLAQRLGVPRTVDDHVRLR